MASSPVLASGRLPRTIRLSSSATRRRCAASMAGWRRRRWPPGCAAPSRRAAESWKRTRNENHHRHRREPPDRRRRQAAAALRQASVRAALGSVAEALLGAEVFLHLHLDGPADHPAPGGPGAAAGGGLLPEAG